jgi:hypothetical protein
VADAQKRGPTKMKNIMSLFRSEKENQNGNKKWGPTQMEKTLSTCGEKNPIMSLYKNRKNQNGDKR